MKNTGTSPLHSTRPVRNPAVPKDQGASGPRAGLPAPFVRSGFAPSPPPSDKTATEAHALRQGRLAAPFALAAGAVFGSVVSAKAHSFPASPPSKADPFQK